MWFGRIVHVDICGGLEASGCISHSRAGRNKEKARWNLHSMRSDVDRWMLACCSAAGLLLFCVCVCFSRSSRCAKRCLCQGSRFHSMSALHNIHLASHLGTTCTHIPVPTEITDVRKPRMSSRDSFFPSERRALSPSEVVQYEQSIQTGFTGEGELSRAGKVNSCCVCFFFLSTSFPLTRFPFSFRQHQHQQ